MQHLLFSYGTLQLEKVQMASFGRKLVGTKEALKGYRLEQLKITDKATLLKSQQKFHPIAVSTGNEMDEISGMLFEISEEELKQADQYEVSDYIRVKALFASNKEGWVYVKNEKEVI